MAKDIPNSANFQDIPERQYINYLSSAYKLIDKLGALNKGYSLEVDNQLGKIRKLTTNTELDSFSIIDPLIKTVSTSINKIETDQIKAFNALLTVSLDAGQALQKTKGLEDTLRRELRMVVNRLKSNNIDNMAELQQTVVTLFNIFSRVKNTSQDNQKNSTLADSSQTLKTLLHGLEQLSQYGVVIPGLKDNITKIYGTADTREQISLCLRTYGTIVEQFGEEFKQTQQLIININKALADVHQTILNSLKRSKSYDKKLAKLNSQIDKQIASLSNDVSEAKTVKELQLAVSTKLEVITESIKQRDKIEFKRTQELNDTLSHLEQKLSSMEERTNFYRSKWLEEKSRSETDSLTSLPNRGAYDKRIEEEMTRWSRHKSPFVLAVLDVDHFKRINDTYGHSVGDKTLKVVAKTLKENLRGSDYLARYGGEEFVCILLDTSYEDSRIALEKVRQAIENLPFIIKGKRVNMSISIGATQISDEDNIHELFDRADKALYEAKSTGRNKTCYQNK